MQILRVKMISRTVYFHVFKGNTKSNQYDYGDISAMYRE